MIGWAAAGSGGIAVLLALRWLTARHDSLGRARSFPVYSVGALAALATVLGALQARQATLEERLSAVAGHLIGVRATVHCQGIGREMVDAGSELGYVRWRPDGVPEHSTLIKHRQCAELGAYLGSDHAEPSSGQVVGVHVLTHEAMHMAGLTSEAEAECAAVQRDAWTARQLGATAAAARRLARTYWLLRYPDLPEEYRTVECRAGGRLDERRADAPWEQAPG